MLPTALHRLGEEQLCALEQAQQPRSVQIIVTNAWDGVNIKIQVVPTILEVYLSYISDKTAFRVQNGY